VAKIPSLSRNRQKIVKCFRCLSLPPGAQRAFGCPPKPRARFGWPAKLLHQGAVAELGPDRLASTPRLDGEPKSASVPHGRTVSQCSSTTHRSSTVSEPRIIRIRTRSRLDEVDGDLFQTRPICPFRDKPAGFRNMDFADRGWRLAEGGQDMKRWCEIWGLHLGIVPPCADRR
jgi:hypothetical protein